MAVLSNARREAFCQARAAGKSLAEAGKAGRYDNQWSRVDAAPEVQARIAEIRRETAVDARDLVPLIEKMIGLVDNAVDLKSAAGMREAKALLVEAARLKGLLPPPATAPLQPPMSRQEWMARFAPPQ